jgi:hypothetical protein
MVAIKLVTRHQLKPKPIILDSTNSNSMHPNDFPQVWPNMIPALEAALLRYEEGAAKMADFRKKYTSVKNKAKRIDRSFTSMDEESRKWFQFTIPHSLRLAENKFILINKKLKRFKQEEEHSCKTSIKKLKGSLAMEANMTEWHIQRVSGHLGKVDWLLYEVEDALRIAKGHLDKVDGLKRTMARYRREGRLT